MGKFRQTLKLAGNPKYPNTITNSLDGKNLRKTRCGSTTLVESVSKLERFQLSLKCFHKLPLISSSSASSDELFPSQNFLQLNFLIKIRFPFYNAGCKNFTIALVKLPSTPCENRQMCENEKFSSTNIFHFATLQSRVFPLS